MEKQSDKIIIDKKADKEMYNLVDKLESTGFGKFKFAGKDVKEIEVKKNKPRFITIEESISLD